MRILRLSITAVVFLAAHDALAKVITVTQSSARLDVHVPRNSVDAYIKYLRENGYRLETFTMSDTERYVLSSRKSAGPQWAFYPSVDSRKAETFIKQKAKEAYRVKRIEQFTIRSGKDWLERCAILFEQKKGPQFAFVMRGNTQLNEFRAFYKNKGMRLVHYDMGRNIWLGTAKWKGGVFEEAPPVRSQRVWAFVMEFPKVATWWRPFLDESTLRDLVQARNAKGYSLTSLTVGSGRAYSYYESGMKGKPVAGSEVKEGPIFQAVFQKWNQNKTVFDSGLTTHQLAGQYSGRIKNGMRLIQIVRYSGKWALVWRKPKRAGTPLVVLPHSIPVPPKPPKPIPPAFQDDPFDPTWDPTMPPNANPKPRPRPKPRIPTVGGLTKNPFDPTWDPAAPPNANPKPRPRPKPRFPTVGGLTKNPFDPTWDPTAPPNATPKPRPRPKPAIRTVGGLVKQPAFPTSRPKPTIGRGKKSNPGVIFSPRYKKAPPPPRRRAPLRRKK